VEAAREVMRMLRDDPSALAAQARLQQIPSLADVQWAILEKGGQISFIPRQ